MGVLINDWYLTKKGVQNTISEYNSNLLAFDSGVTLSSILSKRIERLQELYEAIIKTEQRFYNSFSITRNLPPKKALDTLQDRVDKWNSSGADYLISNKAHDLVLEILTNADYRSIGTKEINDILNDLQTPGSVLYTENQENALDYVLDEINKALEELELSKFKKTSTGFGENQTYWIELKDGKVNISGKIDPSRKSRIKKAIQKILDKNNIAPTTKIVGGDAQRNAILLRNAILPKINGDPAIIAAISEQLSDRMINKFNLARDYGVIKGFLGEVYWNAFFTYLGAYAIPVGDEKDIYTGGSIAVDLIINKFGFQVKNFNFRPDGTIEFGTRNGLKNVGTFIQKRMDLDNSLGDLLLGIYGAYGFHQDYSDGEFTDTRAQLEQLVWGGLDNVFTHYIDRIIRLDAEQDAQVLRETEAFVPSQKTLFNAFFLIGDKIVPSSQILLAIINTLKNTNGATKMSFETTKVTIKEDAITHQKVMSMPQKNFVWDSLKMANQVSFGYRIELNVEDVLTMAYKQFL